MYVNEELWISEKYKVYDYLKLGLQPNSPEEIWKKAIDVFSDRMKGRYFDAIKKLSNNGNVEEMKKYGFSIMSIECLLIDSLVKFRYGPNRANNNVNDRFKKLRFNQENKKRFIKFLKECMSEEFSENNNAEKFYTDIRCGVIHLGSTENFSRLTCDANKLITEVEMNDISVDVYILYKKLNDYFKKYKEELKNRGQIQLRRNFIDTMDYLCLYGINYDKKHQNK